MSGRRGALVLCQTAKYVIYIANLIIPGWSLWCCHHA